MLDLGRGTSRVLKKKKIRQDKEPEPSAMGASGGTDATVGYCVHLLQPCLGVSWLVLRHLLEGTRVWEHETQPASLLSQGEISENCFLLCQPWDISVTKKARVFLVTSCSTSI
jgi:phage terminase large subunit-like protein